MTTLLLPDFKSESSVLPVTNQEKETLFSINVRLERTFVIEDSNSTPKYRVYQKRNRSTVYIYDISTKRVVETFKRCMYEEGKSENFSFKKTEFFFNKKLVAEIEGKILKVADFDNLALIIAVYVAIRTVKRRYIEYRAELFQS